MEDVRYPRSMKPAGAKGHPELCGRWGGGKLASAACLYSRHKLDIEEAVPDDEVTPAEDGAAANEATPAPKAELLNKSVMRESATDKDAPTDDDTGHDLKDLLKKAGLERIDMTKDEAPDELLKDVATGHGLKGSAKEASQEGTCETEGDVSEEKLRDADAQKDVITNAATGHDQMELAREVGLEGAITDMPRWRSTRLK